MLVDPLAWRAEPGRELPDALPAPVEAAGERRAEASLDGLEAAQLGGSVGEDELSRR